MDQKSWRKVFVVPQRMLKTVTERCITDLTRKESYKYYHIVWQKFQIFLSAPWKEDFGNLFSLETVLIHRGEERGVRLVGIISSYAKLPSQPEFLQLYGRVVWTVRIIWPTHITIRFNEPSCNGWLNDDSETGQMVLEPFPSFSFPLFSSTAPRGNPFLDPYLSPSLFLRLPLSVRSCVVFSPCPYLFKVSSSWTKRDPTL